MSLGPLIKHFKPAVGRVLFGLDNKNPEYKKMLEVAETYGMPLGIIQATNSSFWKGYSEVLGVFPYVGTPCLLYTSPSPRDGLLSRMPSSA